MVLGTINVRRKGSAGRDSVASWGGVRVNVNVNVVVRGRSGLAGAGVSGITFVITKLVFLFTVSV